ncbi:MAG: tetraacyldisaccharide 4'-kinase [Candidatus Binatia bacterium]|nr:tetraacyldisaccharide 4'-kinase [Candidatus Binatia bacterium]
MYRTRPNEPVKETIARLLRDVVWRRRGLAGRLANVALQPVSAAYGCAVTVRNWLYDFGLLRSVRVDVPVISVGNLAVGGTGKTPIALWLAKKLQTRGYRVAVVLRGYGGAARGPVLVSRGRGPEVDARHAGDEAIVYAKTFSGGVIVSPERAQGAELARSVGYDVVVLDDGFQHRALARDFDLVLLSGRLGGLLPAGPLRESFRSLTRAHALAVVDKGLNLRPLGPPRSAAGKPLFYIRLQPTALVESDGGRWNVRPLQELSGRQVAAVTGIAEPEAFYLALQQWEVRVGEIFEFGDHHVYSLADWHALSRSAQRFDHLVTTEKDLVKLEQFPFARGKLLALRVEPVVEREEELLTLVEKTIVAVRAPRLQTFEQTAGGERYAH